MVNLKHNHNATYFYATPRANVAKKCSSLIASCMARMGFGLFEKDKCSSMIVMERRKSPLYVNLILAKTVNVIKF